MIGLAYDGLLRNTPVTAARLATGVLYTTPWHEKKAKRAGVLLKSPSLSPPFLY